MSRDVEHPGQRLGHEGLAASSWTNQQDVAFLQFDIAVVKIGVDSFVMIMNSN